MPIQVLMPALSPTMTEGTLARWLVKEGDTVSAGDVIAEIETDKATMEFEAVDEGRISRLLVAGGTEGIAVNTPIAEMDGDGAATADDYGSETVPAPAKAEPGKTAPAAGARPGAGAAEATGRVFASPLARRLAAEQGLDLTVLTGSGPGGRIVKRDIEAAAAPRAGKAAAAARPQQETAQREMAQPTTAQPETARAKTTQPEARQAEAASGEAAGVAGRPAERPSALDPRRLAEQLGMPFQAQPATGFRKAVARRMTESKQTVPHFYLTIECQIDSLLQVRQQLNDLAEGAFKLSVNDFVIRAAALALQKMPDVNASWAGDAILLYDRVDISVAVATPAGLITPIVKDAAAKGLARIAAEVKDLAARARDGKLKPEEFQGGTFSISNLGMYGVREFGAVINPPQSCILAVGQGEQRPVVKDGALGIATMMSCTLSVDHRAVDGARGAEWLQVFKGLIERPLTMLL